MKRMWHLTLMVTSVWMSSCSSYQEPHMSLESEFAAAKGEAAETLIQDIVAHRDLRMIKKSRTRAISIHGLEAISMALFYDDKALERSESFIWISSLDDVFIIDVYEQHDVPLEELDQLVYEIRSTLEAQLDLDFCRINTSLVPAVCDDAAAELDAQWKATMKHRVSKMKASTESPT